MSLKSLVQIFIILVILIILGGVYYNYFAENKIISLEDNEKSIQSEIDIDNNEIKETKTLPEKSSANKEINISEEVKTAEVKTAEVKSESTNQKKIKKNKPKINNVVKDIEYLTTDKSGNKYKILATSGRTNIEDKNVLDLDNVRGIITSDERSTVYVKSEYAEYNSSSLKSSFYQNVVINYEDKEITCDYFDIDMKTNIAIAYNNVVVTDPQSIMKAGRIILNIETKVININPDNKKNKVSLTIN
tara:strand:- start:40 stop:777 length:738 start_codon:yes stop_codon:yes gene_type:complete